MNNLTTTRVCILLGLSLALFASCVSRKEFVYFNQGQVNTLQPYQLFIKTDDILSVIVSSSEPELAVPFNPYLNLTSSQPPGYNNGFPSPPGYLVNSAGEISFPLIGQVKVAGLTREEAAVQLRDKLKAFLKDPVVSIRLMNFRISVMGDVKSPGSFNIPNEKITLPEALSIAGDLNLSAQRKNILIIRSEEGKKTEYRVDLTTQEVFSSPAYYLRQGDIVYVETNRAQRNASGINNRLSVVISFASLIVTTSVLLFR